MKKIGIITQARLGSSRLPRKVLLKVKDKTLLEYHLERLKWSNVPIYVATTDEEDSYIIKDISTSYGIETFNGDLNNVLKRFYDCACEFKLDIIIRVTSDCPLIDGYEIKKAIDDFINYKDDNLYLSNCINRTFPRGMDFEIFSFNLLEEAYRNAKEDREIEHVTTYIRESSKANMKSYEKNKDSSNLRITVDQHEDFELIQQLIEKYNCENKKSDEIISILESTPSLISLNENVEQKKI